MSVRPSHFCPEHISKSIESDLMKLYILIDGYNENCRIQEPLPCHKYFLLKYKREWNEILHFDRGLIEKMQNARSFTLSPVSMHLHPFLIFFAIESLSGLKRNKVLLL